MGWDEKVVPWSNFFWSITGRGIAHGKKILKKPRYEAVIETAVFVGNESQTINEVFKTAKKRGLRVRGIQRFPKPDKQAHFRVFKYR